MSVLCIDNMAFNKLYKKHTSILKKKKMYKDMWKTYKQPARHKTTNQKQDTIMLIVQVWWYNISIYFYNKYLFSQSNAPFKTNISNWPVIQTGYEDFITSPTTRWKTILIF